MPDGSQECGEILEKLESHDQRLQSIETRLTSIEMKLTKDAAFRDGALFALARIGAVTVLMFSFVGWVATGGGHTMAGWVKKMLDP